VTCHDGRVATDVWLVDRSGRRYPASDARWRGTDGSPLMVSDLPGTTRADIDTGTPTQWRYAAALPDPKMVPVSLGEGRTPMLTTWTGGVQVRVKPEWLNPTASFKDRGVSVMISALAQQGVTEILEDSSGNGGSSVAAYAAAAGMAATILAPENTSEAKLLQSRAHGARVELVPGSRSDTGDEAVRRAEEGDGPAYASHNWHPMFLQGTKLLAYEIWEDLGFRAPDCVVVPAGAGSLVLGCSVGFGELVRVGEVARVPRLLVAQPSNCSPLAAAFATGSDTAVDGDWRPTLAAGASIARPVRDREVLAAVRASGGCVVAVDEAAIARATRELARRGLYAEPTSAVAAAALPGFVDRGLLTDGDVCVLVLTGSALKAPEAVRQVFASD
jgi:threonine synthase